MAVTPRNSMEDVPEYRIWRNMLASCINPRCKSFPEYGGKGITVCKRWLVFENFLHDMGPSPSEHHVIDRIDNKKEFSLDNCQWRAKETKVRRKERVVTFRGSAFTEPSAEHQ
jgi:hypothetical protein